MRRATPHAWKRPPRSAPRAAGATAARAPVAPRCTRPPAAPSSAPCAAAAAAGRAPARLVVHAGLQRLQQRALAVEAAADDERHAGAHAQAAHAPRVGQVQLGRQRGRRSKGHRVAGGHRRVARARAPAAPRPGRRDAAARRGSMHSVSRAPCLFAGRHRAQGSFVCSGQCGAGTVPLSGAPEAPKARQPAPLAIKSISEPSMHDSLLMSLKQAQPPTQSPS